MAYPILAPSHTWYKSNVLRSVITQINIVDSYTPTGDETEVWNADVNNSGDIKCYLNGTVLTIAGNGSGKIAMNADSSYLFSQSVSSAADAPKLFINCTAINGLELFDSSNATTLQSVFAYCISLTELDLSSWDVSNVTTLRFAFGANEVIGTMHLTSLNLTNWNITNKLTSLRATFQLCLLLEEIDVSNWDVSNVTDISNAFYGCKINSLDVSNWNTGKVTEMNNVFRLCTALETLDVSKWNTSSVINMQYMFYNCTALQTLDVSKWNIGNVTNMQAMFGMCTALKTLDVSKWNTSSVTNMRSMFSMNNYGANPPPLSVLDVSNWDVSSVTDMGWMFYGVGNLQTIDVSKWDVSKVVSFHHMCAHSGKLVINGYENWKLDSCKTLNAIFHSTARTDWDVSNWDVSGVENFGQMFENSKAVTIHGLNNWNVSGAKTFYEMFSGCQSLKELDLSSFDTSGADDTYIDPYRNEVVPGGMYNMFGQKFYNEDGTLNTSNYMCRLQKITLGSKFNFKGNGNCRPCYLPEQESTYIPGANEKWYAASNIAEYSSADVPNLTADTYYAAKELIETASTVKYGTLVKIANSVREVTGIQDGIKMSEVPSLISSIVTTDSATYLAEVLNREVSELSNSQINIALPSKFQDNNKNLLKVNLPKVTALDSTTFNGCNKLTSINLPSVKTIGASNFESCWNLRELYMPALETITSWGWNFNACGLRRVYFPKLTNFTSNDLAGCGELATLILGADTVCTLPAANFLNATPINSKTGYVYVPSALVSQYQSDQYWSQYASQIRAIEDYPEVLEGWENE